MRPTIQSVRSCRRGSFYIFVLGTAMLLTVIGLSVLVLARLSVRTLQQADDSTKAEVLAEDAVEYALTLLNSNPNWRTAYSNGVETAPVPLGNGTIAFKLVDETDGNLAGKPGDPVRIYGTGRSGDATRIYSVRASGIEALTCLNAALAVGGNLNGGTSHIAAGTSTIASNSDVHGGQANVTGTVEASGTVYPESWKLTGTMAGGVPLRGMPGNGVFDYYLNTGTSIDINSIPTVGGARTIEKRVISPASNPFSGGTNAKGIYVINCQNQPLVITNSRIVGTLVLINPGAGSRVGTGVAGDQQVNWVPAVSNYPCLLVQGDIILSFNKNAPAALKESDLATNFNPSGTPYPYPSGATNTTTSDTYPSEIAGLVYVSGNATGDKYFPRIDLLVVGGAYTANNDTLTLSYDPTYLGMPPPGFTGVGPLAPDAASWRWEKAP